MVKFVSQLKNVIKVIFRTPSLRGFFNDCGSLVQLFAAWRRKRYSSISKPTVVTMIAALIYVVIPFDILPDLFPLLGFVDDVAVLKLVTDALRHEIKKFRIWQNWMEETARQNSSSHS